MSQKKFVRAIVLWSLLMLLAASDLGGLVGFALIWLVIIVVAAIAMPITMLMTATGVAPEKAQSAPEFIMIGLLALYAWFPLRRFWAAFRAWRAQRTDEARLAFVSGYRLAAIGGAIVLSLWSLAEQWP